VFNVRLLELCKRARLEVSVSILSILGFVKARAAIPRSHGVLVYGQCPGARRGKEAIIGQMHNAIIPVLRIHDWPIILDIETSTLRRAVYTMQTFIPVMLSLLLDVQTQDQCCRTLMVGGMRTGKVASHAAIVRTSSLSCPAFATATSPCGRPCACWRYPKGKVAVG
jgi:hypothetical protein